MHPAKVGLPLSFKIDFAPAKGISHMGEIFFHNTATSRIFWPKMAN